MSLIVVPGTAAALPPVKIRLPREILSIFRERADLIGVPFDSLLKVHLADHAITLDEILTERLDSTDEHSAALREFQHFLDTVPIEETEEITTSFTPAFEAILRRVTDHYACTIDTMVAFFLSLHVMAHFSDFEDELDELDDDPDEEDE